MQVDLTRPATLRWDLSRAEEAAARELLAVYQCDLGLPASLVAELSRPAVRADFWDEMQGVASRADVSIEEVVCGNLYYDAPRPYWLAAPHLQLIHPLVRSAQETSTSGAKTILFVSTRPKPNSSERWKVNLLRSAGPVS